MKIKLNKMQNIYCILQTVVVFSFQNTRVLSKEEYYYVREKAKKKTG